jgi:hypothetical protein
MQPAPTRDAGSSSRTWNMLPVVSTLHPAHRRATKALASVALGPMIVTDNLSDAWLYALAPIVGAIIAAVVHMGISVLTDERPAEVAAAE